MDKTNFPKARRSLRDVVCDIDRDILKLLVRRHNFLQRMHNSKGFLDAAEERPLRASWEAAVARVSSDARLSAQFFSLIQELEFFPKSEEATDGIYGRATPRIHTGFNLAPPQKSVHLVMPAPLSCRATRGLLMLAVTSGSPLTLAPCLMNEPIFDCITMLTQAGANLTRENGRITVHESTPLGVPDKGLHAGDSVWNFYLIIAHYLGRPSRLRLSGDAGLKLADFSAVRHFLPTLHARLAHVIPKSNGLPVRLECSGVLPDTVSLPHDVPPELGEALLLAAPCYPKTFTLDMAGYPHRELLQNRVLPLLQTAGVDVTAENCRIRVTPGKISLSQQVNLPMEPEISLFLLAIPLALAGETRLAGFWPSWPQARAGLQLLKQFGLELQESENEIYGRAARITTVCLTELPEGFPTEWLPLPLALAACAALQGSNAAVPALAATAGSNAGKEIHSFLHAVGLALTENGRLHKKEQEAVAWNAPSPIWALAFALTACARPHLRLGNPGIMAGLYPGFWPLYNGLPEPMAQKADTVSPVKTASRRRVISSVPASIPKEEEF
ncbi:MAG: 3-phosphoshikimate 1-carboxyvinyltransferase [Desulfovibrio sp.]|jgi:5-enolpyruvylshikimate-3-phosphate synthase|nr:3-phosphoshikimate 1-carboxyvinyltransferase [Desulfovibrio sp.]